jgi:hypothetical protein
MTANKHPGGEAGLECSKGSLRKREIEGDALRQEGARAQETSQVDVKFKSYKVRYLVTWR